ncbi:hypothetical protein ACO0K7_18820 [Undibacterium sp. Ji67W]|uniref:hypothetical protein n=1 Tax=Undibacterium sp. Ji67W TaxID=3413042 RepID=UPI003BF2ECC7
MREVTGVLSMLGSGSASVNQIGKSFTHYDTIEIGDQILQKLRTARSLNDFIERGLGREVTLYLIGNRIIGVKLPDSKLYYWRRSKTVVFICVLLTPLWGIGLIYALLLRDDLRHILSAQPKLATMGGIPLKS